MKAIINKLLSLYIWTRYRQFPKSIRYYLRANIHSRNRQHRFLLKDYCFKKPYKKITYNGEFGAELLYALPFAYWHYKNGTLAGTQSVQYTRSFYFFSPHHEEQLHERQPEGNYNYDIPNMPHAIHYDYSKWAQVPLKSHYKNDIFIFQRPILIVANRYNMEWGKPPISYFDTDDLDVILKHTASKYQVIYNRPGAGRIVNDNSEIQELNETSWLTEHYPNVLLMEDLFEKHKSAVDNFNHLQLMVYANCGNFISIHGGTSTLASYFGGTNIIFSKWGVEHAFKEYETLYPRLSGARIVHVKTREELYQAVTVHF